VATLGDDDHLLRSTALLNAHSILLARQRAEAELLRTREALRQSQERLTAALTAAGTGTFRWDIANDLIEWDGSLGELLGFSAAATRASLEGFLSVVHADDRPTAIANYRRCATEGSDLGMEFRAVWPDSSVHWIEEKARTFPGDDGTPSYVTGACVDVTARKQTEATLRDETRLLELLNASGQMLASRLDLPDLLQAVTDAATELAGAQFGAFFYNTTDATGDAYQLYALSGAPREAFDRFGQPRASALFGPTFRGEGPVRCDDVLQDPRYGSMSPHHGMPMGHLPVRSYLATPIRSRTGAIHGGLFFGHPGIGVFTPRAERLVVGIAAQAGIAIDNARLYEAAQRAADDRKALLDSERTARSAAERMSDMKDEFLATLSHELRTPLNAILGWAKILRTGSRDAHDLAKGLETIERNARVQTQLIDDLLDMSRITSGKLRLDIQPIMPATFIEAAIETAKPAADARGIRLEKFLDPSAGPVSGDPGRLQQVVWNLLSNAIKFTPRGGKAQVVLKRVNSHIEISVADTGCGIKPEFMPYLFDRFRQADAATTRQYGGLGLGLSIVRSLVELHGGTIHASSPGEDLGTTVTIHLPLMVVRRPDQTERLHPTTSDPVTTTFQAAELTGITVLVVDDQPDARDLVKRVLEDSCATVLTAADVKEALRLVEDRRPDVLVTDIGMPEVDGYELLKRVRALGPLRGGRLPAIALTAFARSEDRTRALRAGFLVHVAKPVDPSELVATVASICGRVD
jgi:PAS domain S-box-containing protein